MHENYSGNPLISLFFIKSFETLQHLLEGVEQNLSKTFIVSKHFQENKVIFSYFNVSTTAALRDKQLIELNYLMQDH